MTQDGWRDSTMAKDAEDRAVARAEARRLRRQPVSDDEAEGEVRVTRREAAEAHAARYGAT